MIVSGPDQAQAQLIAKHLSSGTARLGNIGGKQVLIMTPPAAPVPPKAAELNTPPTLPSQVTSQQPTQGTAISPLKVSRENKTPVLSSPSKATEVTAQLIQTPQGPRIILQGIQGANLSRDQLLSIQQQVKTQLLKAQAEAKLENRVPPTKIAVILPPSIQERINQQKKQQINKLAEETIKTTMTSPPPPPPPQISLPPTQQPPQQYNHKSPLRKESLPYRKQALCNK
ncbi:Nucleosomeremodeling factor subunit NURF301like [Caligus rogercresseyi]|uniref:Nucleosomeremodeling factor subunit NURF301like n=1 Tax=Caligus rogercresseyi TaxID=217165 RepID=A0A7T8HLF7_CALRO|nr:Nucleosomeremodeling factor subunit NURF301like [Caligus rogercresseyi]